MSTTIHSADGREIREGDRVFDYYNGRWGTVGTIGDDGWFAHVWEDQPADAVVRPRSTVLNGDRVAFTLPESNPFHAAWKAGLEAPHNETEPEAYLPGAHDWDYQPDADIFVCSRCASATDDPPTHEGYCVDEDVAANEAILAAAEAHRAEREHTVHILPGYGWVCSVCDEDADEVISDYAAGRIDIGNEATGPSEADDAAAHRARFDID